MNQNPENPAPSSLPTEQTEQVPAKKREPVVAFRLDPIRLQEFNQILEYRKARGLSHTPTEFIKQMFDYVKKNPYGDFPTGK